MGKDPKFVPSSDTPLISAHSSRYSTRHHTSGIDYEFMNDHLIDHTGSKNTPYMNNMDYSVESYRSETLHPKVEKTRQKSLNMQGDSTGVLQRFLTKTKPIHNYYYILSDQIDDLQDTYYLDNKPYTKQALEKPFNVRVDTNNLGMFAADKRPHLSHDLDNKNSRLIRNVRSLKEV